MQVVQGHACIRDKKTEQNLQNVNRQDMSSPPSTCSQDHGTNHPSATNKSSHAVILFSYEAEVTSWAQIMRKAHGGAKVQCPSFVQEELLRLSAGSNDWS